MYSSAGNKDLHIGRLSRDYTDVVGEYRKAIVGASREAPALFRHGDQYFMITSGCTGWDPNKALVHTARYAEAWPACDSVLISEDWWATSADKLLYSLGFHKPFMHSAGRSQPKQKSGAAKEPCESATLFLPSDYRL